MNSYFKIEKKALNKNKVAEYFKKGEGIEDVNGGISKIYFIDQRIIKYN